jgi:predicted RNA-binding Zn ribbon-like protein
MKDIEDSRSSYAGMRDSDRVVHCDGRLGRVLDFAQGGFAYVDFDNDHVTRLVESASLRPEREAAVMSATDMQARALALLDEIANLLAGGATLSTAAWQRLLEFAPSSVQSVQYHYHLAPGQRLAQVGDSVIVESEKNFDKERINLE